MSPCVRVAEQPAATQAAAMAYHRNCNRKLWCWLACAARAGAGVVAAVALAAPSSALHSLCRGEDWRGWHACACSFNTAANAARCVVCRGVQHHRLTRSLAFTTAAVLSCTLCRAAGACVRDLASGSTALGSLAVVVCSQPSQHHWQVGLARGQGELALPCCCTRRGAVTFPIPDGQWPVPLSRLCPPPKID